MAARDDVLGRLDPEGLDVLVEALEAGAQAAYAAYVAMIRVADLSPELRTVFKRGYDTAVDAVRHVAAEQRQLPTNSMRDEARASDTGAVAATAEALDRVLRPDEAGGEVVRNSTRPVVMTAPALCHQLRGHAEVDYLAAASDPRVVAVVLSRTTVRHGSEGWLRFLLADLADHDITATEDQARDLLGAVVASDEVPGPLSRDYLEKAVTAIVGPARSRLRPPRPSRRTRTDPGDAPGTRANVTAHEGQDA